MRFRTAHWFCMTWIAQLLVASPLVIAQVAEPTRIPAAGEYTLSGGMGTLQLGETNGAPFFAIEVVGANAHTCQLEGAWEEDTGTVSSGELSCSIEFEVQPDGVDVRARNAEACRQWCGARAWFEGRYLSPIPECAAAKVKRARDAFKSQYKQKRYGEARATLAPVLARCKRVLDRFELMWVRNDLAVTLHHLGEGAACLEVLDPIRPLGEEPETEVGSTEPAFAEELKRLARATRTNLRLCRGNPAQ